MVDDGRLWLVGALAAVAAAGAAGRAARGTGSPARDPYIVNVIPARGTDGVVRDHVRIRRDDDKPVRTTWDTLQAIKDRVLGPDATAVEVYPARHDMVDEANIRHLWAVEELPFGLQRGSQGRGSRVRPGPRLRPATLPSLRWDEPLPTGLANLDEALGNKDGPEYITISKARSKPSAYGHASDKEWWPKVAGWPRGRVVELFGPNTGVLEILALQTVAAVQARGGTVAWIDAPHTFDTAVATKLGVDLEHALVAQPDTFVGAQETIDGLVRSGAVELVVVHRLAVGAFGEPGTERQWSQMLRALTASADKHGATILFVNATKSKAGSSSAGFEEAPQNGVRFYSSVRVDARKIDVDHVTRVAIRVVKSKLAAPFRTVHATLVPGCGLVPTEAP